jgi:hypothetical protein
MSLHWHEHWTVKQKVVGLGPFRFILKHSRLIEEVRQTKFSSDVSKKFDVGNVHINTEEFRHSQKCAEKVRCWKLFSTALYYGPESSVQGVELCRYFFNSVELEDRTRDVGSGRGPGSNFACVSGRELVRVRRKKRFTGFPSPAGMSLTKLPLGRYNSVMTSLFPPRESLVVTSRPGTGNSRTFFYGVRCLRYDNGSFVLFHSKVYMYRRCCSPVTTTESIPVIETQARGGGGRGEVLSHLRIE